MSAELPRTELARALEAAVAAATRIGCRAILFGGLAVGVRGRRRATDDVDVVIAARESGIDALLSAFAAMGAVLPERAAERIRRDGMLGVSFRGTRIDVLLPADPLTESLVEHATEEVVFGLALGVARAEELIAMKVLARRPKDVEDVKGLLAANRGRLDLARVRRWLPEIDDWKPGGTELFERLVREFYDPAPPPPA